MSTMLRQVLRKLSIRNLSSCEPSNRRLIQTDNFRSSQKITLSTPTNMLPFLFLNSAVPKISPLPSHYVNIGQTKIDTWGVPMVLPSLPILKNLQEDFGLPIGDSNPVVEKQAARMVVIRRRKMKKHKLRKLRKVRKFEYRRIALKRKTLKEKTFQMELMDKIKVAEKFDPKAYVENLIITAKEENIQIRGKRPGFKFNPTFYDEKGERIRYNSHLRGKK